MKKNFKAFFCLSMFSFLFCQEERFGQKDPSKIRILLDGVYFELGLGGIGEIWRNVIQIWETDPNYSDFDLMFIKRRPPQKKFPPVPCEQRCLLMNSFSYKKNDMKRQKNELKEIFKISKADFFLSTYHSNPGPAIPHLAFLYDLIPFQTGNHLEQHDYVLDSMRDARDIVSISNFSIDFAKQNYPDLFKKNKRIHIIPPAVNPLFQSYSEEEIAKTREKYQISEKYFLSVQLRENHKNCKLVRDFLNLLAEDQFPKLTWVREYDFVVVSGTQGCLQSSHFEKSSGKYFDLSYLPQEDLAHLYAGAFALLFPSIHEGFGMPIVEAYASETPVVLQRTSVLPEVAGDAGFYYENNDPKSFSEALDLLTDDSIREDRISQGVMIASKYQWSVTAEKIAQVIRSFFSFE
jgi:alpha-1,3-rhamnosyl/mannosyltransferase